MSDRNTGPGDPKGNLAAWAKKLAVTGLLLALYWWLSNLSLEHHLLEQSAHQQQQLDDGWRWEFDYLSDLVGRSATGLKSLKLEQGQLSGYRSGPSGFISLNFNGQRLDANIHHILQLRIWLQRPAPLGLFHTEFLGEAVISTPAVELQAGWQLVELDLADRNWQTATYRNQQLISGPDPSSWGGKLGIVSSLRLHPSMRANNQFRIDWVRLISNAPTRWSMRPTVKLTSLDESQSKTALADLRAPLIILPDQINTVEQVLGFRDHLSRNQGTASLLPNSASGLGDSELSDPRHSWPTLALAWLAGLTAILATIAAGRRRRFTRAYATLQLTGLLVLVATLLTWPDMALLDDPELALTLGLLVALAILLLGQFGKSLNGKFKLNSRILADTALLTTICIIPLFILSLFSDQLSQPELVEVAPRLGRYLVWASVQQLVLCIILLGIMERLGCNRQSAMMAAAGLFGLAHFPNFALMAGSLVLAQLCLWLYRRHDSLLSGVVLHAVLGTLYLELMPVGILRSGAIGMRFFF
jgi:hypothetical protein